MVVALALHIALTLPPALPRDVARAAVAEAADIWAPYGVAVDPAGPCGWAPDGSTVLEIVMEPGHGIDAGARESRPGSGWRRTLGAVTFAPDGTPAPVVTVFMSDLLQIVARSTVLGTTETQWPQALHRRLVGRVLGRVLAHEIGHIVLRMPRHAGRGLMRPAPLANDLVSPSRDSFTLSPLEVMRLALNRAVARAG